MMRRALDFSKITPLAEQTSPLVDPRESFLGRASARHILYGAGKITLDDAFGDLVEPFKEIVGELFAACDICGDAPCSSPGFCQTCRAADRRGLRR